MKRCNEKSSAVCISQMTPLNRAMSKIPLLEGWNRDTDDASDGGEKFVEIDVKFAEEDRKCLQDSDDGSTIRKRKRSA